jgi:hypothetical protein
MTVLHENPEYYIQQCHKCGAILKYSLNDIHVAYEDFFIEGFDLPWIASDDSIVCACCKSVLTATKQWFYDPFLLQKLLSH